MGDRRLSIGLETAWCAMEPLKLKHDSFMLQEVEVLHLVSDHPNIALLVGAFEDKSHVHLVLEVCNGGELFDRIVSKGNLSERQAAEYFRTMVQVAAHCHQLGTCSL